jgi:SPP1 family predicted phage head-tail adaptor
MLAGKLRHRVTLQQRAAGSPQKTAMGAPATAWTDVATVWGSWRPLSGRELLAAQQVASKVDVEVIIRYRAGVTAAMRLIHVETGTVANIEAVIQPDMRRIQLTLRCSTGVNSG